MGKNKSLKYCIAISASALLLGCGGGNNSTSTQTSDRGTSDSSATRAYLLDSAVIGAKYVDKNGNSNYTKSNGIFNYISGNTKFYVGNVYLGDINYLPADRKVFIQDIVGVERTNIEDKRVINIGKFLQSIDSDNSTRDIEIGSNAKKFSTNYDLTNGNINVESILLDAGFTSKTNTEVVSHLNDTLLLHNIRQNNLELKVINTNARTGLSISKNIIIQFSDELNLQSVNSSNFRLRNQTTNEIVKSTVSYDRNNKTVIIDPIKNLEFSTNYILELSKEIKNSKNKQLKNDMVYKFKTSSTTDTKVPTVSFQKQTENISINSNLVLAFSEDVEIQKDAISLRDEANNIIEFVGTYDKVKHSYTIDPTNSLKVSSRYLIKVDVNISDKAGNTLESAKVFSFKTKANTSANVEVEDINISTTLKGYVYPFENSAKITIDFTDELNAEDMTILNKNIVVNELGGYEISGEKKSLTYKNKQIIVSLKPLRPATYEVTIKDGLIDVYDKKVVVPADKQTTQFIIDAQKDSKAPHLENLILRDGDSSKTKCFASHDSCSRAELSNISTNPTSIELAFSEKINQETISQDNISVIDVLDPVKKVDIGIKATTFGATITFNEALKSETTYALVLSENIKDLSNNKLNTAYWSSQKANQKIVFKTAVDSSDKTAPIATIQTKKVNVFVNEYGDTEPSKSSDVIINFSKKLINHTTMNKNIRKYVETKHYSPRFTDERTLVLTPNVLVKANSDYTIRLTPWIKGLNNVSIKDTTFSFRTIQILAADTTGPKVTATYPIDGKTIGSDENLTVSFNEDLETSTINANIQLVEVLADDTTNNIEQTTSYSNKTITINPTNSLKPYTNYKLIIKRGLKDKAGNNFKGAEFLGNSDKKVSFTIK